MPNSGCESLENCTSVEVRCEKIYKHALFWLPQAVASQELADLFPTLLQIFLTIMLGRLAGFYNIIPKQESKGLNLFVGKFSLPVLIFVSLENLNFKNIDWSFLVAITISKSIIFVAVGVIQFIIQNPKDLSRASIFAAFKFAQIEICCE